LLYIERRFVPKYNSHIQSVESVLELGSNRYLPKEAGKGWQCKGGIAGSG